MLSESKSEEVEACVGRDDWQGNLVAWVALSALAALADDCDWGAEDGFEPVVGAGCRGA